MLKPIELTDSRKIKLFNHAMSWIFIHTKDYTDYTYALREIGYTDEEALEELEACDFALEDSDDAEQELRLKAIKEAYEL